MSINYNNYVATALNLFLTCMYKYMMEDQLYCLGSNNIATNWPQLVPKMGKKTTVLLPKCIASPEILDILLTIIIDIINIYYYNYYYVMHV